MRHGLGIVGLSIVLLAGCSSAMQQGAPSPRSGDESLITSEELRAATETNLFEFVQLHRHRWLERNFSAAMRPERVTSLAVFVDNQPYGGPDALRQIALTGVGEVRYYRPSEAQARFGVGYLNGVIQVISRTQR
jgi:hypothetical protein